MNNLTPETLQHLKSLKTLLASVTDFSTLGHDQLVTLHFFLVQATEGVEENLGVEPDESDLLGLD